MIKNKESYVRHVIDYTPRSYCQRGSTSSAQNRTSVFTFNGKEYTSEFDRILLHLLHCQCNLTKGFNNLFLHKHQY